MKRVGLFAILALPLFASGKAISNPSSRLSTRSAIVDDVIIRRHPDFVIDKGLRSWLDIPRIVSDEESLLGDAKDNLPSIADNVSTTLLGLRKRTESPDNKSSLSRTTLSSSASEFVPQSPLRPDAPEFLPQSPLRPSAPEFVPQSLQASPQTPGSRSTLTPQQPQMGTARSPQSALKPATPVTQPETPPFAKSTTLTTSQQGPYPFRAYASDAPPPITPEQQALLVHIRKYRPVQRTPPNRSPPPRDPASQDLLNLLTKVSNRPSPPAALSGTSSPAQQPILDRSKISLPAMNSPDNQDLSTQNRQQSRFGFARQATHPERLPQRRLFSGAASSGQATSQLHNTEVPQTHAQQVSLDHTKMLPPQFPATMSSGTQGPFFRSQQEHIFAHDQSILSKQREDSRFFPRNRSSVQSSEKLTGSKPPQTRATSSSQQDNAISSSMDLPKPKLSIKVPPPQIRSDLPQPTLSPLRVASSRPSLPPPRRFSPPRGPRVQQSPPSPLVWGSLYPGYSPHGRFSPPSSGPWGQGYYPVYTPHAGAHVPIQGPVYGYSHRQTHMAPGYPHQPPGLPPQSPQNRFTAAGAAMPWPSHASFQAGTSPQDRFRGAPQSRSPSPDRLRPISRPGSPQRGPAGFSSQNTSHSRPVARVQQRGPYPIDEVGIPPSRPQNPLRYQSSSRKVSGPKLRLTVTPPQDIPRPARKSS